MLINKLGWCSINWPQINPLMQNLIYEISLKRVFLDLHTCIPNICDVIKLNLASKKRQIEQIEWTMHGDEARWLEVFVRGIPNIWDAIRCGAPNFTSEWVLVFFSSQRCESQITPSLVHVYGQGSTEIKRNKKKNLRIIKILITRINNGSSIRNQMKYFATFLRWTPWYPYSLKLRM